MNDARANQHKIIKSIIHTVYTYHHKKFVYSSHVPFDDDRRRSSLPASLPRVHYLRLLLTRVFRTRAAWRIDFAR